MKKYILLLTCLFMARFSEGMVPQNPTDKLFYALTSAQPTIELVTKFIEEGADINAKKEGFTPLILAIRQKNNRLANFLLSKGAKYNINDLEGYDALHNAVIQHVPGTDSYDDIIVHILRRIKDDLERELPGENNDQLRKEKLKTIINQPQGMKSLTLLHHAVTNDDRPIIKLLIDNGANLAAQDTDGDTPLHYAARAINHDLLKYLIPYYKQQGISLNIKNKKEQTPVEVGKKAEAKSKKPIAVPQQPPSPPSEQPSAPKEEPKKIAINAKNRLGQTRLHILIAANAAAENIQHLLDAGIDINAQDNKGNTPLHFAVENENPAYIQKLLDSGADVNVKDNNGNTPLHFAVEKGNLPYVDMLVEHHADIDITNNAGHAPIHYAIVNDFEDIAKYLVDHGAGKLPEKHKDIFEAIKKNDIPQTLIFLNKTGKDLNTILNTRDDEGNTPLTLAIIHNKPLIVGMLIAKGAATNPQTLGERPPLYLAAELGNLPIMQILMEGRANINVSLTLIKQELRAALAAEPKDLQHIADLRNALYYAQLYLAVEANNLEIITKLIDKGAKREDLLAMAQKQLELTGRNTKRYEILQTFITYLQQPRPQQPEQPAAPVIEIPQQPQQPQVEAPPAAPVVTTPQQPVSTEPTATMPIKKSKFQQPARLRPQRPKQLVKDADDLSQVIQNSNFVKAVEILSANPNLLNTYDSRGNLPLHTAILNNQPAIAELLLMYGADVDAPRENTTETPLYLAAQQNNVPLTNLLLTYHANPHIGDITPLALALSIGADAVADILQQLEPTAADILAQAIEQADINKVRTILFQNPDLLAMYDRKGNLPLHTAVLRNQPAIARLLLREFNAPVDAMQQNIGETALHLATRANNPELVELLLGFNANALIGTTTPLNVATRSKATRVIPLLKRVQEHFTRLLTNTIERGDGLEVARILQEHPQLIHIYNDRGNLPLHTAVLHNQPYIAAFLITSGADINAPREGAEEAAIDIAAKLDNKDLVKLLIDNGAQVHPDIISQLTMAEGRKAVDVLPLLREARAKQRQGIVVHPSGYPIPLPGAGPDLGPEGFGPYRKKAAVVGGSGALLSSILGYLGYEPNVSKNLAERELREALMQALEEEQYKKAYKLAFENQYTLMELSKNYNFRHDLLDEIDRANAQLTRKAVTVTTSWDPVVYYYRKQVAEDMNYLAQLRILIRQDRQRMPRGS
jgi:ankyrin repeat protein